jgi:CHASE3 domain sensor protein
MPISSRLVIRSSIVLLTIGFLALLGIVASTAWLSEKSSSYFELSNRSRALRVSAVELRSALQSAESSQRGYLVGGNEIHLAPYDAAKAQAIAQLHQLKELLPPSARNENMLNRLTTLVSAMLEEMDQIIALKTELDDNRAAAAFRSNRGKAMMDEANLFLSSIIRQSDERLEGALNDQRQNATLLRLTTIIGGLVIVLVVAGVTATVFRYASEVTRARNELGQLNLTLEDRVTKRTAQLSEARDRAELLVAEVNHRVANSLALVASVVRLQSNLITDSASKEALKETEARILAVAAVHKRLYTSDSARFVDLQEY